MRTNGKATIPTPPSTVLKRYSDCFVSFFFVVPRDCCVVLPHYTTGLSVVCDCGIT